MKTKNKPRRIQSEFVEFMPDELSEGIIYISLKFATAKHKCFCGCGLEVVTPINPVGWQVLFDGETVSLFPSIGNWNFPCRSHYLIRRNRVVPAKSMTLGEIEEGRAMDREERAAFFGGTRGSSPDSETETGDAGDDGDDGKSWLFGSRLPKKKLKKEE